VLHGRMRCPRNLSAFIGRAQPLRGRGALLPASEPGYPSLTRSCARGDPRRAPQLYLTTPRVYHSHGLKDRLLPAPPSTCYTAAHDPPRADHRAFLRDGPKPIRSRGPRRRDPLLGKTQPFAERLARNAYHRASIRDPPRRRRTAKDQGRSRHPPGDIERRAALGLCGRTPHHPFAILPTSACDDAFYRVDPKFRGDKGRSPLRTPLGHATTVEPLFRAGRLSGQGVLHHRENPAPSHRPLTRQAQE